MAIWGKLASKVTPPRPHAPTAPTSPRPHAPRPTPLPHARTPPRPHFPHARTPPRPPAPQSHQYGTSSTPTSHCERRRVRVSPRNALKRIQPRTTRRRHLRHHGSLREQLPSPPDPLRRGEHSCCRISLSNCRRDPSIPRRVLEGRQLPVLRVHLASFVRHDLIKPENEFSPPLFYLLRFCPSFPSSSLNYTFFFLSFACSRFHRLPVHLVIHLFFLPYSYFYSSPSVLLILLLSPPFFLLSPLLPDSIFHIFLPPFPPFSSFTTPSSFLSCFPLPPFFLLFPFLSYFPLFHFLSSFSFPPFSSYLSLFPLFSCLLSPFLSYFPTFSLFFPSPFPHFLPSPIFLLSPLFSSSVSLILFSFFPPFPPFHFLSFFPSSPHILPSPYLPSFPPIFPLFSFPLLSTFFFPFSFPSFSSFLLSPLFTSNFSLILFSYHIHLLSFFPSPSPHFLPSSYLPSFPLLSTFFLFYLLLPLMFFLPPIFLLSPLFSSNVSLILFSLSSLFSPPSTIMLHQLYDTPAINSRIYLSRDRQSRL
ncbi:hypothetical protein C7M84_019593 [Penaeus vannamei]|uniref:Uncharacterized protein n=1 Tax=Penaeus vannamei TaxID=6689 RepID=A0A3R7QBH4_PENVA|nr:hypothetical protein C7M84_019593 [Penaeus vannamei]